MPARSISSTVLDAQRQALTTRDALVQAQVGQATALVAVYRALGGGWPQQPSTVGRSPTSSETAARVSAAADPAPADNPRR